MYEDILPDFDECPAVTSVANARNAHRVDLSHSPDICTLLLVGSQHI